MSSSTAPISLPAPVSANRNTFKTLWRCYGYLRPYGKLVLGAYLAMLGTNIINVAVPQ